MKTCSILISNYNSFEAIQLCIESVRRYTKYPHEIIVYDDRSTNVVDRGYFFDAQEKGWIKAIFGINRLNHGGAINKLLDFCDIDLAMILDNDIQILESGWLEQIVKLIKDDVLIACNVECNYKSAQPSYPTWMQTWFMMLNMRAYRDGMEVDWSRITENGIMFPVGAKLWIKTLNDNPKEYRFINIPESITKKYRHFAHVSCIATEDPSDEKWLIKARKEKLEEIKRELTKLRSQ